VDTENIETVLGRAEILLVAINQSDLVTFHGEPFAEKVTDLSGPDYEYVHLLFLG
jgi:hypothetical protein